MPLLTALRFANSWPVEGLATGARALHQPLDQHDRLLPHPWRLPALGQCEAGTGGDRRCTYARFLHRHGCQVHRRAEVGHATPIPPLNQLELGTLKLCSSDDDQIYPSF